MCETFFPHKIFSFGKHPSCWKVLKNYGFKYILSKGKVLKVILEKMMSEIMPVKRSGALTLSHDGE